jgi:NAD(P)-dependent dehydrogenase (short-subunit alcohol dehydrogenase family)
MTGARCVVVTGGAHGIGAATVRAFIAAGDRVVIADVDNQAAQALADELGPAARAHHLDAASSDDWQELAASLRSDPPAVIVNNAFRLETKAAHELSEASWQNQLDVTLGAVYRSIRTFHAELTAAGGSVVNVSSVHAIAGAPGHPAYAAAKGGVLALTRQLAAEYGPEIRVNSVLPGPILTRTWDGTTTDFRDAVAAGTALKRLGRADEVAAAIVFLASPQASFITGADLLVDGGQRTTMP